MGFIKEFKTFIDRGNVLDLAVGVVIGAAFGKIVSSFVADILTPPLGLIMGGVSFTSLKLVIGGKPEAPVTINYGNFLQNIFDFLLVAFAIYILIKGINRLRAKPEEKPAEPPAPSKEESLLTEIRDILKSQKVNY
jgi:large conductance mechanosensitive channel